MQKTITFIDWHTKRDFFTDNLECRFKFSVVDSALIGTPREKHTSHKVRVTITDVLMSSWELEGAEWSSISDVMLKVALQSAEEHIANLLREGKALEDELPLLTMETKNSPAKCPYNLANIRYPQNRSFTVETDEKLPRLSFECCLDDFVEHIRTEKRMIFWRQDATRSPKWISRPENLAKDLLHTFLNGRFGASVLAFEEITSGAGRMDLFIVLPSDERTIVELKMCGRGYTQGYAQEGLEQLLHYMANKNATAGYLVVFDARVKDFGKGFSDADTLDGVTIRTVVADVRPFVKLADVTDDE